MLYLAKTIPVSSRPRLALQRFQDNGVTLATYPNFVARKPKILREANGLRSSVAE